jgi:hypothetical protein
MYIVNRVMSSYIVFDDEPRADSDVVHVSVL